MQERSKYSVGQKSASPPPGLNAENCIFRPIFGSKTAKKLSKGGLSPLDIMHTHRQGLWPQDLCRGKPRDPQLFWGVHYKSQHPPLPNVITSLILQPRNIY